MSHLLRIALPDVPGSLGAVASALGAVGVNIEAIEIVEHRPDGTAIDDLYVDLPSSLMPDTVVSAVQRLDGVRVLWISRYAVSGNQHLDLEAIDVITDDPIRAVHHLTQLLPRAFRSDWALVVDASTGPLARREATANAPDVPDAAARWLPLEHAQRLSVDEQWPGWSHTEVAAAPLGNSRRIIVLGRDGGPEILNSEVARLSHLAALTATLEASLDVES